MKGLHLSMRTVEIICRKVGLSLCTWVSYAWGYVEFTCVSKIDIFYVTYNIAFLLLKMGSCVTLSPIYQSKRYAPFLTYIKMTKLTNSWEISSTIKKLNDLIYYNE